MNSDKEQNSVLDQGENIKKETPQQNELNLDFSEMEPITPKKTVEPKVGLIERLKFWRQKQAEKWQQRVAMKKSEKTQSVNSDTPAEPLPSEQVENEQAQAVNTVESKKKARFLSVLPIRHRRLAITLIGIVVILLIFFWLKPEQSPVDSLQNGNVAITYQPLDQSNTTDTSDIPWLTQPADSISSLTAENTSTVQNVNSVPSSSNTTTEQNSDGYTIIRESDSQSQGTTIQNAGNKDDQAEAARALAILNGGSVSNNVAPVEPVAMPQAVQNVSKDNTSTKYKTLVITSGKSLMQVFRDNHLNISDVVAMNKTRGSKALSRFKPGDKVQVNVKNGRVSELRLSDGSRFIRNADGSYQYQK